MASVLDRLKRDKNKKSNPEWTRNGSFLNKPDRGWIHPDSQLEGSAGICYGVRYIGCIEVKVSMRTLDFDTRTNLAREAINKISEAGGLKTTNKKRKADKKVLKMLGDLPNMQYAGSNVNLTITTESLNLMVMETGEIIADHLMSGISFASGGDAETLDFIAYVAKDSTMGRACHVLECGGGLSEDVITTIGQAFELRFKDYLKNQPKAVTIPEKVENSNFDKERWGEENDYYNDRPGACPPSPIERTIPPEYSTSPSNLPVSDGVYSDVNEDNFNSGANQYDVPNPVDHPLIDFSDNARVAVYDNPSARESVSGEDDGKREDKIIYDNESSAIMNGSPVNGNLDPFNMEPFVSTLPSSDKPNTKSPQNEEWFHGAISRKEADKLLINEGDFLVRESTNSPGQFVLSGRQDGVVKHLLLVDPEGAIRTKDHIFDSVSHLVNYHQENKLPILSQESELFLLNSIKKT